MQYHSNKDFLVSELYKGFILFTFYYWLVSLKLKDSFFFNIYMYREIFILINSWFTPHKCDKKWKHHLCMCAIIIKIWNYFLCKKKKGNWKETISLNFTQKWTVFFFFFSHLYIPDSEAMKVRDKSQITMIAKFRHSW